MLRKVWHSPDRLTESTVEPRQRPKGVAGQQSNSRQEMTYGSHAGGGF